MTARMSGPSHGSGVRPADCQATDHCAHGARPTAAATALGRGPQLVGVRVAGRRGSAAGSEWAVNTTFVFGRHRRQLGGAPRRRGSRRTPARSPSSRCRRTARRRRRRRRRPGRGTRRSTSPSSAGRARARRCARRRRRRARRRRPRSSGRRASARARRRTPPGARSSSAACSASRWASVSAGERRDPADRLVAAGQVGELLGRRRPPAPDVGVVRPRSRSGARGVP